MEVVWNKLFRKEKGLSSKPRAGNNWILMLLPLPLQWASNHNHIFNILDLCCSYVFNSKHHRYLFSQALKLSGPLWMFWLQLPYSSGVSPPVNLRWHLWVWPEICKKYFTRTSKLLWSSSICTHSPVLIASLSYLNSFSWWNKSLHQAFSQL